MSEKFVSKAVVENGDAFDWFKYTTYSLIKKKNIIKTISTINFTWRNQHSASQCQLVPFISQ